MYYCTVDHKDFTLSRLYSRFLNKFCNRRMDKHLIKGGLHLPGQSNDLLYRNVVNTFSLKVNNY